MTAQDAPLAKASSANALALKFGPFKAKNIFPFCIFRVSVQTPVADWKCANKDEFDIIRENIKEYLLDELLTKQVDLIVGVSVKLEGLIDKEKFETQIESKLTDNVVTELINDSLTQNYTKFEFEKTENYYLWSYKKGE
jgi:hypothetical protein